MKELSNRKTWSVSQPVSQVSQSVSQPASQSKRRSQSAEGKIMRVETAYFFADYTFTVLLIKWASWIIALT
jgi:hypothetical protein